MIEQQRDRNEKHTACMMNGQYEAIWRRNERKATGPLKTEREREREARREEERAGARSTLLARRPNGMKPFSTKIEEGREVPWKVRVTRERRDQTHREGNI